VSAYWCSLSQSGRPPMAPRRITSDVQHIVGAEVFTSPQGVLLAPIGRAKESGPVSDVAGG